jgi:hypothetical protein
MTVPHIRLDRRQFYLFEGLGINSQEAKSPRAANGVASSAGTTATVRKSDRVFRKLNALAQVSQFLTLNLHKWLILMAHY